MAAPYSYPKINRRPVKTKAKNKKDILVPIDGRVTCYNPTLANAIKDVDKNLTQLKNDLVAQAKDLTQLEKRIFKLENKTTKTLEKQEKMQDKLNQVKDIVNMETK